MNAADARKAVADATRRREGHNARERHKAEVARKAEAERQMKKYNTYLQNILDGIRDVASREGSHFDYTPKHEYEINQKLREDLRKRGFHITDNFVPGTYENMGDFNAPCNIWCDAYTWWRISW